MHRLPPKLIAFALALSMPMSMAMSAAAAPPTAPVQPPISCAPVEHELENTKRALADARKNASAIEAERLECNAALDSTNEKLAESTNARQSVQKERDHICSATSAFAEDLVRGRGAAARDTGCVSPDQQTRLEGLLSSWTATTTTLTQLGAYESGEVDVPPSPRNANTPLDRLVQRALGPGRGSPLAHRRLLVEAMKLVAPEAWERIRASGPANLDAWFLGTTPLDPAIVEEAQHASARAPGPAGPPLPAALRLVLAYQVVGRCNEAQGTERGCGRAKQLEQLLETTGPLVVRRRVQEIWATECSSITPSGVLAWVDDFPTPFVGGQTVDPAEITEAAHAKLFSCFLGEDVHGVTSYRSWLASRLPGPTKLVAKQLPRIDAIRAQFTDGSAEDTCARAARAIQSMPVPTHCELPSAAFREAVEAWANRRRDPAALSTSTAQVCDQYVRLLWEGKPATIAGSFARPPSLDDMVVSDDNRPDGPMSRLRQLCADRRGDPGTFEADVRAFATTAKALGEPTDGPPFRVDANGFPVEKARYEALRSIGPWLEHLTGRITACNALHLGAERCAKCLELSTESAYDCALATQLEQAWTRRSRILGAVLAATLLAIAAAIWVNRLRKARAEFGTWAKDTAEYLAGIGLTASPDRLRTLFPSRYDVLEVTLPHEPAWERWGNRAVIVRAPKGTRVLERDVNHAAAIAIRTQSSVVILSHDNEASPDLGAVRAMLEWAAKGGTRAVQILPLAISRLRWSNSARDLLDLVEESSLRGNPFELRGRIAASSQFFNRERLVSGLLAAAQAGHWFVITGLRRFGKSSLALEVARRLPGPSAYVDLSGFDHEIGHLPDPAAAVNSILRYVCLRLAESARARWPDAAIPEAPAEGANLDASALMIWFRDLSRACRDAAGGRSPPMLVILDEIEQALAVGPDKLGGALDVLAILVGRLKSAVGDSALPDGGSPIGVFLASALHPLLWAPLKTLAHQSIMGSFQRVCVPCLTGESASAMMQSLGARQGIRFKEAALEYIVAESGGVPLLLRRIGSSVLELYDAERARQGSLGAVEIGVEGSTEAVEREEREGSPLRVWVETEICQPNSPAGAMLRRLAREPKVSAHALREVAKRMIAADFVRTGIDRTLAPEETARRTEEAASVMVQLLAETGLLEPHGDLTAPEAYSLRGGAIRRVLRVQPSVSVYPSAHPVS